MKTETTETTIRTDEIIESFTFADGIVRLAAVTYTWTRGDFRGRRAVSVRELGAR